MGLAVFVVVLSVPEKKDDEADPDADVEEEG